MGTLSEKLTRIKDAMTQIRSGFDLEDTVIESVASTTTELHASQTQTLAENAVTIQDLNTTLNARNNEINRLNATVNTQETTIQSQAQTITTLNETVDAQVVQISTLENTIATKDATINELNETVLSKDAEIANLNARIEELENPSASEPEYINLTVSMRTDDNSSLPDDFTYSIDVYDADNNAIYTNLSPDAISGEHNEVAFSDMPEDFIVGNTYTVIARSWSEGYVIISDNPYYFTVDHNNTEACFTLQVAVDKSGTSVKDGDVIPAMTRLKLNPIESANALSFPGLCGNINAATDYSIIGTDWDGNYVLKGIHDTSDGNALMGPSTSDGNILFYTADGETMLSGATLAVYYVELMQSVWSTDGYSDGIIIEFQKDMTITINPTYKDVIESSSMITYL